jgi:hypothetical protein
VSSSVDLPLVSAKVPSVPALRLVNAVSGRITTPFGAVIDAEARAWAVALGPKDATDVAAVARVLPDPDELPPGTLLFVLPAVIDPPTLGSRFLAALGRGRTVPRALRATALVSRGYVGVAAGVDRETRSDLVWGYAPPEAPSNSS